MNQIDLSFFLEPPELSVKGVLKIEALGALSMNIEQPGTYYQSLSAPTPTMLYGLLENALGWHFSETDRKQMLKNLRRIAKRGLPNDNNWRGHNWLNQSEKELVSNSGFLSLLCFHLQFSETVFVPPILRFNDLWSRHVHSNDTMFPNGSRNHDYRMDTVQSLKRKGVITFSDRADVKIKTQEEIGNLVANDSIHPNAVRDKYPLYYISPTPREYIIPQKPYCFCIETTPILARMLKEACNNPEAPLYLGTSEGWVELSWEEIL